MRTGDLTAGAARLLVGEFEADWYGEEPAGPPRFAALATDDAVLEQAARLSAVHGLRAYDAVQLASAATARAAAGDVDRFACFDAGLRAAAAKEAFRLLPPE